MAKLAAKLFLLTALCVGLSELAVRTVLRSQFEGVNRLEDFYSAAHDVAARDSVDVVFVGTSRVAGSVAPDVVATVLSDSLGDDIRVVNVGKGYSSLVYHYYGLRELYRDHAAHMRGALVMIEAPSGIPLYETWDGKWTLDAWPTLMGPFLSSDNVVPFLMRSDNGVYSKAVALASAPLMTVRVARYVHPKLEEKFNMAFSSDDERGREADLSTAGGIRADSAGVAMVRARILEERRVDAEQGLWEDWEGSVTASIVRLVRAHGGDVMFFEMPESSYQVERHSPPARRAGEQQFGAWAADEGLSIIRTTDFTTSDDDFPDLLHMRASRSGEYSQIVAQGMLSAPVVHGYIGH